MSTESEHVAGSHDALEIEYSTLPSHSRSANYWKDNFSNKLTYGVIFEMSVTNYSVAYIENISR